MKVWMLTGDNGITAKEISISSGVTSLTSPSLDIPEDISVDDLEQIIYNLPKKSQQIFVPGWALDIIFSRPDLLKNFLPYLIECEGVVLYRSSPGQKAQVVSLIREHAHGKRTLSIGDGANDVAMIISAHVGVGIQGKEGNQASAYADYALVRF